MASLLRAGPVHAVVLRPVRSDTLQRRRARRRAQRGLPPALREGGPAHLAPPRARALWRWLLLAALLHAAALGVLVLLLGRAAPEPGATPIPIAWLEPGPPPAAPAAAPSAPVAPQPAAAPPRAREPERRRAPRAARPGATPAPPATAPIALPEPSPGGVDAATPAGDGVAGAGATGGVAAGAAHTGGAAAGALPRGLRLPKPAYPPSARRDGVEGTTHVRLRIDAEGRVPESGVQQTSGDARLDAAAVATVRRWLFAMPPSLAGRDGAWFVVPIEFRLR